MMPFGELCLVMSPNLWVAGALDCEPNFRALSMSSRRYTYVDPTSFATVRLPHTPSLDVGDCLFPQGQSD